jgi:hypothetical protein
MSSNPEPSYVPYDIFAQNHLLMSGKTNGSRASETGLSGKAKQGGSQAKQGDIKLHWHK